MHNKNLQFLVRVHHLISQDDTNLPEHDQLTHARLVFQRHNNSKAFCAKSFTYRAHGGLLRLPYRLETINIRLFKLGENKLR